MSNSVLSFTLISLLVFFLTSAISRVSSVTHNNYFLNDNVRRRSILLHCFINAVYDYIRTRVLIRYLIRYCCIVVCK